MSRFAIILCLGLFASVILEGSCGVSKVVKNIGDLPLKGETSVDILYVPSTHTDKFGTFDRFESIDRNGVDTAVFPPYAEPRVTVDK